MIAIFVQSTHYTSPRSRKCESSIAPPPPARKVCMYASSMWHIPTAALIKLTTAPVALVNYRSG